MRMGLSRRPPIEYKHRHIVYKIYFYIIFILTLFFFSFVTHRLEKAFISNFTPFALNIGSDAFNYTVAEYFSDNKCSYKDFVDITYGENNSVTALQANTPLMNRVIAELSILVQDKLDEIKLEALTIPFGNLCDNLILHGIGPNLKVKVKSAEINDLTFCDTFEAAGINQVRHKIYIDASITISVSCANMSKTEVITDKIPVAETIIVGNVPKYFAANGKMSLTASERED